jgi:hypothetical protein
MQERNSQEHSHTGDEKEVPIIMGMASKRWSLELCYPRSTWIAFLVVSSSLENTPPPCCYLPILQKE